MGIVNVTADSFSDGGRWMQREAAIDHAFDLVAQGADIIDVGGESTRPGAERVPVEVELQRTVDLVSALTARGVLVSVDTMRAAVAEACVVAGAGWINDVSGGLADADMLPAAAELGCGYIAMHWRGHSDVMQSLTDYADVAADVASELAGRRDAALAAGVRPERLVLDPGIGFAKTPEQNWELLAHPEPLEALGFPLLYGVSRKRFLGDLLGQGDLTRPASERDDASAAFTALLAQRRAWGVRTHTVRQHRDAIAVVERLRVAGEAS